MSDRPGAARPRRGRGALALAAGMVLAAVLAGGCATLPSSGEPLSVPTLPPQGGGVSTSGEVIVQPPQPGWDAAEVVSNFLLASANFAHNYRMARAYLTKSASDLWHPGSQVTILSGVHVTQQPGRLCGLGCKPIVLVGGRELATLSSNGQYITEASNGTPPEEFILQTVNGTDKIAVLPGAQPKKPSRVLLLTSDLFHLAYAPRDIYYYGQSGLLLPDPVYVPIQGTNPVDRLISDLRNNPAGLLGDGAAQTYFPDDAKLAGLQVLPGPSGRTAIVNIALPRGTPGPDLAKMAAQLVATLTSSEFSPPLFHAVRLRINGQLWPVPGAGSLTSYAEFPNLRRGMNVYYLAQNGSIRTLGRASPRGEPLPSASGVSQPPLSQVAVSRNGRYLAGISGPGTEVYTGGLIAKPGQPPVAGQLHAKVTARRFTSLSWDESGDLWIVGKRHSWKCWVLVHGQGTLMRVNVPQFKLPITAIRVAPDGVRVALIVGKNAKAQVWLAAAVRGPHDFSLTQPVPLGGQGGSRVLTWVRSVTWYDEDHLLAVAGPKGATQLWEVPVDGDNPSSLVPPQAGLASVTAAGPGNPFYLALTDRQLERAAGPNQLMQGITAGQAPSYPG